MRRSLALLVIGLVLLSGCASQLAPSTPTAPETRAFPTPPESITADTVGEYAASFEEVYRYNVIVAAEDDLTSVSVGCHPVGTSPIEGGYRVVVNCGFGWMYESEGSAGVADGRPYNATYRVTGGLVERVGSTLDA